VLDKTSAAHLKGFVDRVRRRPESNLWDNGARGAHDLGFEHVKKLPVFAPYSDNQVVALWGSLIDECIEVDSETQAGRMVYDAREAWELAVPVGDLDLVLPVPRPAITPEEVRAFADDREFDIAPEILIRAFRPKSKR
jgi:hypothetical protein